MSQDLSQDGSLRLDDLDPLVVGMEFVLTLVVLKLKAQSITKTQLTLVFLNRLESPCLDHLHGDPEKPEDAAGHSLTASAQLVSMYPKSSMATQANRAELCRQIPTTMLDSLLTLSNQLGLTGEVTPVQAWHQIRCQPNFGGFQVSNLRTLAEKIRDTIKCHGLVYLFLILHTLLIFNVPGLTLSTGLGL